MIETNGRTLDEFELSTVQFLKVSEKTNCRQTNHINFVHLLSLHTKYQNPRTYSLKKISYETHFDYVFHLIFPPTGPSTLRIWLQCIHPARFSAPNIWIWLRPDSRNVWFTLIGYTAKRMWLNRHFSTFFSSTMPFINFMVNLQDYVLRKSLKQVYKTYTYANV